MKQFFIYFLIFGFTFSCVGSDTSFLPENIQQASKQKLLIDIYNPTQKEVIIENQTYKITDAFTTYKTISKNDIKINKSFFAFIFRLKNMRTGQYFEFEKHDFVDYYNFINFYSENGGIHDSSLSIIYDKIDLKNKLDTIKIGFKDSQKNEKLIKFIKEK